MSADIQENTVEQWKAVRGLLKEALLAGEIPLESKLYTVRECKQPSNCRHCLRGKFTRMLCGLLKKHNNGNLQNEDKTKAIEWSKSAAKQFLKRCF
jgi:hypothetical protein